MAKHYRPSRAWFRGYSDGISDYYAGKVNYPNSKLASRAYERGYAEGVQNAAEEDNWRREDSS